MKPAPFEYRRAETVADAVGILAADDECTPVSGGQSLLILMRLRLSSPTSLLDVTGLGRLGSCERTPSGVRIGAATTHSAIEDGLADEVTCGLLPYVASGIAYRAVRNLGTIGGSLALADPSADWPLCLLALDATVVIEGTDGPRSMAMDDFLVAAFTTGLELGELLTAVEIPALPEGSRWGYVKLARKHGAFADSLCAVVLPKGGTPRVALGATSDRARLLTRTAERLAGEPDVDEEILRHEIVADLEDADPDADPFRKRRHAATILKTIRKARAK